MSLRNASGPRRARAFLYVAAFAILAAGCTPKIGDKCVLSTDCSQSGDRLCDVSQPNGYCTLFNCAGDTCPDKAACVMFESAVPGCAYTDRGVPRTGRTFCVAECQSSSDCRDGYVCADPRQPPWKALILDDLQTQLTCLVDPLASFPPADQSNGSVAQDTDAAVCSASGPSVPPIEAGAAPTLDAGIAEAGADAAAEAGTDAGFDSGTDSGTDAGSDSGADAADGM